MGVRVAGAPSTLIPLLPLLSIVSYAALGDVYNLLPHAVASSIWCATVFLFAKRRKLFLGIFVLGGVYGFLLLIVLAFRHPFNDITYEFGVACLLGFNQISCSYLCVRLWTSFHVDCPPFFFSLAAASFPVCSET